MLMREDFLIGGYFYDEATRGKAEESDKGT
jgi:hypothetical protein